MIVVRDAHSLDIVYRGPGGSEPPLATFRPISDQSPPASKLSPPPPPPAFASDTPPELLADLSLLATSENVAACAEEGPLAASGGARALAARVREAARSASPENEWTTPHGERAASHIMWPTSSAEARPDEDVREPPGMSAQLSAILEKVRPRHRSVPPCLLSVARTPISHRMYSSIRFRMPTATQNRQLNVLISNSEQ